MEESLVLGENPTQAYYAVRGDTNLDESHIDKFHECGICSRTYQGTVWVITSTRFLYPGDKVKQRHINLINIYNDYLNEKPKPEDGYQGHLPFGTFTIVDYTAMAIVGGDGPRATWYHYWKDGLLYVHENNGKVSVYEVFDPNESLLDGAIRRKKYGMRRLGTATGKSVPVPTPQPGPEPVKPDDDPDDDIPMPNLFGDDDSDDDDPMIDLFD